MNNQNLWFILLIAGISLLQWLARKAKEQQSRNQQKRSRQRVEEEALRTGRSAPTPTAAGPSSHDAQQARLRELAEMRRRQLEEMRRQQREAAERRKPSVRLPQAGPGSPSGPSKRINPSRVPPAGPMSSGPIVRPGQAGGGRVAPRQATTKPVRAKPAPPKAEPAGLTPSLKPTDFQTELDGSRAARQTAGAGSAAQTGRPANVDWRRAIVLAEALGPPLALRPPTDGHRAGG